MLNLEELKLLFDKYLETLDDVDKDEDYGTEKHLAERYIIHFVQWLEEIKAEEKN